MPTYRLQPPAGRGRSNQAHGDGGSLENCPVVFLGEVDQAQNQAMDASRAIFLDKRVLQWKPGVLLTSETCQDIMDRFDAAMPRARELLHQARKAA